MTHRLRFVAVAACVCMASAASAQSLGQVARETEEKRKKSPKATSVYTTRDVDVQASALELANYEITAERWRTFKAADASMMRVLEQDPALFDRLDSLKGETVTAFERSLAREPKIVEALQSAGSNPRDYASTQIALLAAMMIAEHPRFSELSGQLPPAMRANVDFVRSHESELRAMRTQMLAMRARMGR